MKRKIKKYSRPKRPFDKERIEEEAELKEKFGLKNKKEIWKTDAKVKSIREKAKKLIPAGTEEKEALFNRLRKMGFEVNSIADALSLDKRDYLERRLQTMLVRKNLATTSKSARQLIVHKKVLVDGKIVSIPSYMISRKFEDKITIKKKSPKKLKTEQKNFEAEQINKKSEQDVEDTSKEILVKEKEITS